MPSDAMRVVVALSEIPRTTLTLDEYHAEAATVIERAIADAVAEREALIVKWLNTAHGSWNERADFAKYFAARIKRGDHKEIADG